MFGERTSKYLRIALVNLALVLALSVGSISLYGYAARAYDSLWITWAFLAVLSLIIGFAAGWLNRRWGLVSLIFVPLIFLYLGPTHLNTDGWWRFNMALHLIPILPGLLLGIAAGSFVQSSCTSCAWGDNA